MQQLLDEARMSASCDYDSNNIVHIYAIITDEDRKPVGLLMDSFEEGILSSMLSDKVRV